MSPVTMSPVTKNSVTMKTVLLVIARTSGGTGRHVRVLAEGLVRSGHRVSVCGPQQTQDQFDFTGAGARFAAVEISSSPRPADLRAVADLRRRAEGHDLVHAHGLRAAGVAALAVPRTTPLLATWHNATVRTGTARHLHRALERLVARRARVILAVAPDLVATARALGAADVRLAPVSAPEMEPPRRSRAEVLLALGAGTRPVVLSVGRLTAQKAFGVLVEAAARLGDRTPPPLFVVAGDGPDRALLQARIDRIGAPVRLLGERSDVADLLAAADVLTLSSAWEGSPLTVQEGLRAGVPFVGTAVGGIPALVGDGGLLVPPGNPGALADALRSVLAEPSVAADLAARALAAATRLPTDASVLAEVESVYAEVLGESDATHPHRCI